MQHCALDGDVTLKVLCFLDLNTILSLSKASQSFYRLSLSSLSFWINAVDAHKFPVPIPTIRDHYKPEEVRYMARVIACYQQKVQGSGKKTFNRPETSGIGLSSTSRIKFRQEGLARMSSGGKEGLLGVSSAMVQGYTANSLPWLISIRARTIRCDSIDEEYITGFEWEADGLVDWFWMYDIQAERDSKGGGRLREYVTITFLTNGPATFVQGAAGLAGAQETLQKIKIYLPFKTELVPIPKTTSYRGAFGALISSSPPPVVQDPSAVAPRVAHHDRIIIPKGFNCAICRPATDGSQVYLLARKKHQPDIPLGTYIFWVFLFNWKTRRRIQVRLPEEESWRKVMGSGHTVILQDWRDKMYTLDLSSEFAEPFAPPTTPGDEDSLTWRLVDQGPGATPVHIPLKHQEEANLMPVTGNIFQTTGETFCLISRLGERLYCHLFRRSSSPSKEHSESRFSPHPGFTHIGAGHVDIDGGEEELGVSFLHKTRGTRSLLGYSTDDETKRRVCFFIVDFEIDFNQDGTDGPQLIQGKKREFLLRGERPGQSSGSRNRVRSDSLGSKLKGIDHVLGRNNMQEVFFDAFRGTVGMMNKEYSEIVLFRATRD